MELGLSGRVALVAGSSRGLGRAVAEALAREGARLVLCARRDGPLQETAGALREAWGSEVLARPADVTSESEVKALVDAALERFGRLDILVANAGGPPSTRFLDTDPALWRQGLDLNLLSTILLCRAVVPPMQQNRWGRIVAITSVTVKQPLEGLVLSNVSRLGVVGLAKSLANELAPAGILVNVVCPGFTRTERLIDLAKSIGEREAIPEEEVTRRWTASIPLGRLGEPEEFGALVAFLCSERASYITGTCIQVDGGFVRTPI